MGKNDILTQKEIDELATSLTDLNKASSEEVTLTENDLEIRFERALEYVRSREDKFLEMSLEEIFKWFYLLGVNTDVSYGRNLSIEEVMQFIENEEFIEMVSNAIKDPSTLPKTTCISLDDKNNVVKLISECVGYDCACSPQREDHCISEDNKKCVITVPMKRLNELIGVEDESRR